MKIVTNQSANDAASAPIPELAKYYQQISESFKDPAEFHLAVNPDTKALMPFNGYYTLNTAPGAFFAIDTNMHYNSEKPSIVYLIDFLISLDGINSYSFPFLGTFDGTQLKEQGSEGFSISLSFAHTNGPDGTTASCTGIISLPGGTPKNVSGKTYNNPIPASLYIGDYYATLADKSTVKAMSIGSDNKLYYDNGTNSGNLTPVTEYVYNLNMYYFNFMQGEKAVRLIMGTAAEQGFACNNMIVDFTGAITTRSLLTIPNPTATAAATDLTKFKDSGNDAEALAGFSGYYQIQGGNPLAFVSVQAQYISTSGNGKRVLDIYTVKISVSTDGVTSKGYSFDPTTMTFKNNTLTMPGQSITLTFNRQYNPQDQSLVTLTGTINGNSITGYTLFNPVPLMAFGGVTMKSIPALNGSQDTLDIVSNNEVIYNGEVMDSIIYVPLMYIVAYPAAAPTIEMSLGTDGLSGNVCIILDKRTGTLKISLVCSILPQV